MRTKGDITMKVLMCSDKDIYFNMPGGPDYQFINEDNLKKLNERFEQLS